MVAQTAINMQAHVPPDFESGRLFAVDMSAGMKALKNISTGRKPDVVESGWYELDREKIANGLAAEGDSIAAYRFLHCREPGLGWVGQCCDDPTHETVYHPFSCMLRICPVCGGVRSNELAKSLTKPIADLAGRAPHWYRLKHVVLTTTVSLDDGAVIVNQHVRRLRKAIRVMFQNHWPGDKWLGGAIGAEFGESGRKLHFHVLLLSKFIPKDSLSELWFAASGGLGKIVFVREVQDVASAVAEVAKYATKPMKFEGETEDIETTLVKVHFAIKGSRRLQTFGSFYDLERDDEHPEVVCPDCGGWLDWMPELEWMQAEASRAEVRTALDLIPANKLSGRAPPGPANNLNSLPEQTVLGGGFDNVKPDHKINLNW